ncbi:MAG: Gfo/Idh/MocA family oxidoreductase, partial [Actinomycetia bacterium]|nr:Gfo/Idh/MocA family oxidoreductase [Actinomycetes bacterium]
MTQSIGIGVVGFGWMGQAHSRSYLRIPMLFPEAELMPRLLIVADNVPERAKLATQNFGFEAATADWRDVVGHPEVEVVVIGAPNKLHREIAVAAAGSGKAIFCEKPVGEAPAVTAEIEYAARKAGVVTGVGFNYRWAPLVQHLKQLI